MRVEVEHGVAREAEIAIDQLRRPAQGRNGFQISWWITSACGLWLSASNEQFERAGGVGGGEAMPRQREPRAPVLRIGGGNPAAQVDEPLRRSELLRGVLEPIECQVGALRRDVHHRLPRFHGQAEVALLRVQIAEVQVGRRGLLVALDRRAKPLGRLLAIPEAQGLFAQLVLEKRQDRLVADARQGAVDLCEQLPHFVGFAPLMLLAIQFLELHQRVTILRVEAEHFLERFVRAIDKAAAAEVEAQAEQDIRVLQRFEPRAAAAVPGEC